MLYSSQCYCGNALNLTGTNAIEPNTALATTGACTGDPYEYCGNSGYTLVYPVRPTALTASNVPNPWIPPGDGNYKFNAVWLDVSGIGALLSGGALFTTAHMDVEICLNFCATTSGTKYKYAGLEGGG
jgi:hypothetical protein